MAFIEFIQANPRWSIIVFAFIVTLFITIVTYFMTDRERMKELKQKQKDLRKEMKKHRDNPQKMMELNQKLLEDMPEQLKHSFKPMIITIVPLLIFFGWLRSTYADTIIGGTGFLFPAWLWWYLGASIIFSIIIRKMVGLQ